MEVLIGNWIDLALSRYKIFKKFMHTLLRGIDKDYSQLRFRPQLPL